MNREMLRDSVLVQMNYHLDAVTMDILKDVLTKELAKVEITDANTLPATTDNTNRYLMDLYRVRRAHKLSTKTIDYYMATMQRFMDFINKPITMASEIDVERFLLYLHENGNNETSVNNNRRNLCSIFSWFRKQRLIMFNPVESVDPFNEIQKPIDHLTAEEQEQLKEGCEHPRDRALLEFLRCTALRGGEIPAVQVSDIDWQTGKIVVFQQKTHSYKFVMIDEVAKRYIKKYIEFRGIPLDSNEPLFIHKRDNTALNPGGLRESIKDIAGRAGVRRNVYTHLFRKSTATTIIKRGGSVHDAGHYLGHKDNTTAGKHYAYTGEDYTMKIFNSFVAQK